MADNFLNNTGLAYYHNRIKTIFPSKTEFDALDAKVDGIVAEGGEPNVIETVKVNGVALTPDAQKAVDVTVPTATSDLTNDSGFQNSTQVQALIDASLAGITGIDFEIVQTLPQTGDAGTIYLVSHGGSSPNVYDEFIYVNGGWEKIGSTDVDLTQYWAKSELVALTTAEIDALFA